MCLSLLLLLTALHSTNSSVDDMTFARVSRYQKVADQILLTSAMNGWIHRVAEAIETDADPAEHLSKITSLCPDGLSCQVCVLDQTGARLKGQGELRGAAFGEASYTLITNRGSLRIVCRVSQG